MGSDIALNCLKKIPKKELGLAFDNLLKPKYINMRSVTNGCVVNGGIESSLAKSKMINF